MNRFLCMVAGLSAAALLIAGCGGTSLSSNVARIRAYDGATGTTSTATIYINNGSANGSQNYGQVSSYLYVNSGTSTFAWAVNNLTGGSVTPFPATLNPGSVYSAILLGNASTGNSFGPSSPILDVTVDDQTSPPSGQSRIRIIHDAPDAGSIDVYINGSIQQSSYAYPGSTITGLTPAEIALGTPFSLQNFNYSNAPAGTVKIQINEAGTNTVIAGPTSFPITGGGKYTFFLNEPTVSPSATYSFQQITDSL
jgi:hypothetical protein